MFDLLVIGAGPGGYTAAARAAKLGLSTAIVEERSWGGTCLNRGCVPTKTLLHASEVYRSAADGAAIGIHAEGLRADIPEIFAYKERISRQLCGGVESLLKGAGVTLLRGRAVITAPGSVRVTGEDGGDYEARRILIATGSVPVRPPIPGLELAMTSDELLEGADHLYRSIVIIGGGVIGVEFATFYSDLGCSVTLLEGMDRLLPNMDRELGQNLALILKKQGVQVCTRSMVDRLEQTPEGIAVHYTAKETPGCAVGEAVLCAIGRRAFRDGLFAQGLTPETNGHGLWVDEHYQTSIPGVFAAGNVLHVHDLVDFVSLEAEALASSAAEYLKNHVLPPCPLEVRAGANVGHVIPQRIRGSRDFTLSLRVSRPMKAVTLTVTQDGREVLRRRLPKALPAEMLQLPIRAAALEQSGDLEVSVQ